MTMHFVLEQIPIGGDRNFGYLIGDRKKQEAVLVDPAYQPEMLLERAHVQSLRITYILNTHGHSDHTNGNSQAKQMTQAPIAAYKGVVSPDLVLEDNSTLQVGDLHLRFLHTPGHADDHLVIYSTELGAAITGDLIFVGKVGGTATDEAARTEWASIERVLTELPDTTTVWPGHDYGCRPASTLALERQSNPFVCCEDEEAFLQLKRDWSDFKSCHGLK